MTPVMGLVVALARSTPGEYAGSTTVTLRRTTFVYLAWDAAWHSALTMVW